MIGGRAVKPFYEIELERIENAWKDTHPERVKKFKEQYLMWGFSDEDTWSLDIHLAKLILPRLKRYKELATGAIKIDFPLDEMIEAFQILHDVDFDKWKLKGEKWDKVEKGLKAFAEHYFRLWW
jgi:hypothetical protein